MSKKQANPIKVLFRFAGEAKGKMTLAVILAIPAEIFGMLPYLTAAMLASQVFQQRATWTSTIFWTGVAVAGILLKTLLNIIASGRSHKVAFTILRNIRIEIADKMKQVPLGVMLETPTGHFKNLIVDNVAKLEDVIAHFIPEIPSNIAAPAAGMTLIFMLDWRMGLASLITIPICIPFMFGMLRGYAGKMDNYVRAGNEMNGALVEYVGGIQVIKAFSRTNASFGKFSNAVNFFHDSTLDWWQQCWFWMSAVKAIMPSTLLGSLPIGAYLFMVGQITLPVLIACIIIPIGALGPLMRLAGATETITTIAANLNQITKFLKTPVQIRPNQGVIFDKSAFVFKNVSFSYDSSKEVLHDISFTVKRGTVTAIVGSSGSGKSTIAKLMAGFWDVSGGDIFYGGYNVKDIPFKQLMDEISYVAQDNFLFNTTLRENIRMGNPKATDADVEEAAKAANCHSFIMQLPNGYDTMAGDAGDRLSGGERQRITIARAMMKKSSVVILDEATAYADPESEAQIQQAVGRLIKGKTLVVVAHRLSTIQHADQILVVDNGCIAAMGTQPALLASSPLYKCMWEQHISSVDHV